MPYHHGDLRRALIDAALLAVAEHGPAALSLREVARRTGVSHAAPTHHFRNKTGLLTAIAGEGWAKLGDALAEARARGFAEQGVAYVVFATENPAHFAVMRAPDLLNRDDPDLAGAQSRAGGYLREGAAGLRSRDEAATPLAAWALVHGLANLLLEGNVTPEPGQTVEDLARAVTHQLTRR